MSCILEERRKGKSKEYLVMTPSETREWITEEEAKYNCPKKLKAYRIGEEQHLVSDSDP